MGKEFLVFLPGPVQQVRSVLLRLGAQFFDLLLDKAQVVVTPGSGFGPAGEGYFRITSFADRQRTIEALDRIKKIL